MNDRCGCCEGIQQLTPRLIVNRPGLDALVYRVGTHAAFLESMKARLSNFYLDIPQEGKFDAQGKPQTMRVYPLSGLTTRTADDPSIALLDAWATVADVLSFYQERIANEGYLRTAIERRSILEIARLVGYRLRPGVAATVYLAYTLDSNFKDETIIPVGTRAQSVPGPGELPQSFETSDKLQARTLWNVLKPRLSRPQTADSIQKGTALVPGPRVYLKGITTNLKPNDPLLIDFAGTPQFVRVKDVQPDAVADRTLVTLQGSQVGAKMVSASATVATAIERFRAGETVSPKRKTRVAEMAQRVAKRLDELQARIDAGVSEAELINQIERVTLPKVSEELLVAKDNPRFTRLTPRLSTLVEELRGATQRTSAAETAALALSESGSGDEGKQDSVPFSKVLQGLVLAASVPPASTFQLKRDVGQAFALKADTGLQLVTTFQPTLSASLPAAIANAKVTPDSRITVYALRVKAALFGHNAPKKPTGLDANKVMQTTEWDANDMKLAEDITAGTPGGTVTDSVSNVVYLDTSYDKVLPDSWVVMDTSAVDKNRTGLVQLVEYPTLIAKAKNPRADISRAVYGITGKTTRIELADPSDATMLKAWIEFISPPPIGLTAVAIGSVDGFQIIRRATIYAQSEPLDMADEPIEDEICKGKSADIELDSLYNDLQSGRWLIVSGERSDIKDDQNNIVPGVQSSELVMLSAVRQDVQKTLSSFSPGSTSLSPPEALKGDRTHTFIRLSDELAYCYKRDTVTIYGNVVKATHGETRQEVLGSGDGSKPLQTFALRQPPLTYVAAPTPAGAESTLHVRVNDVEWQEMDSLFELGPNDRKFITRTDDDGKTSVIFGNGQQGARPPTGNENIKAVYRNGIGKAGNVKAEQINQLATRPLGVKDVINPLRATGGADKESRDQARSNAPLAILALDRLVSTQDYADFARTFAGIGKASAARLSDGRRQLVHVTIAGADDIPIDKTSDLYRNLVRALRDFGDPYQPLQVELRELMLIVISANVRIQPDHLWESVASNIRAKLLDTFSFERRELGQDVLLSEVISVIQLVDGVVYVDVDLLRGIPEKTADQNKPGKRRLLTPAEITAQIKEPLKDDQGMMIAEPLSRVVVNLADFENVTIRPAQLAFLTAAVEATLILNEVKP